MVLAIFVNYPQDVLHFVDGHGWWQLELVRGAQPNARGAVIFLGQAETIDIILIEGLMTLQYVLNRHQMVWVSGLEDLGHGSTACILGLGFDRDRACIPLVESLGAEDCVRGTACEARRLLNDATLRMRMSTF